MNSPLDLQSFLRTRRSIRRFGREPVPGDVLERIIVTATSAPSAHNRQPWRFAVLTDDTSKSALAEVMSARFRADLKADGLPEDQVEARVARSRSRITSTPAVIVLCMDASEMDTYPDAPRNEAERTMAIQSTANAGLMLLLAAHAEGLGGVWNCAPLFAAAAVKKALQMPQDWEPQALLLIGQPAETPRVPDRKPLSEVLLAI